MARKRKSDNSGELFIEGGGQLRLVEKSVEQETLEKGKVECLGLTFDNEDERRAHFTQKLREKLADPAFREIPGFPKGSDEDIIRMSDPPWYTACPNPFLREFATIHGKPFDPSERYERDPFAVDVSVGKTDPIYRAHSYHTKVPHLAIVPSILHYTEPGDLVLDGFSGSGMTGVAAQWCGSAPAEYRKQLEIECAKEGRNKPTWGFRRSILSDLAPAATFIAANYVLPFDRDVFSREIAQVLRQVNQKLGWVYETLHSDKKTKGVIKYTVWSDIFNCGECGGEINFVAESLDLDTKRVQDEFPCPHCKARLTKKNLERFFVTRIDSALGTQVSEPKREPVLICYSVGNSTYEKKLDAADREVLGKLASLPLPSSVPIERMMHASGQGTWGDKWRAGTASFTHVHHLYLQRSSIVFGSLWQLASQLEDERIRNELLFTIEQVAWTASCLNRYRPGSSFGNGPLKGVYYISSQIAEANVFELVEGAVKRVLRGLSPSHKRVLGSAAITTSDCGELPLPENCIDYIFTDPPFGSNFAYAELNFVVEAWHRVYTATQTEAIVSPHQRKGVNEYQDLMRRCFTEYHRILKPGRWMTVVFSNSSNAIWRAIQEAMGTAGFVVADVRTLDKQQGSFNQVHGVTVDQDLIISVYKPTKTLSERFTLGSSHPEGVWAFVSEHLAHVPIFFSANDIADVVAERTGQVLHDRMVAFHVQRQLSVPLSAAEFFAGLTQRYSERDGMYFLPVQVAEYDRKRNTASELRQLSLFVTDEATAIQWVRRELQQKPRSFQDLQPPFMREIQNWAKHEETVELKEILRQNFIHYDGNGPLPSQIHSYLSTNFKELRNLAKDDPTLIARAADRWYVADPNKQVDLEKLRDKTLLAEFETYKQAKDRKLKLFRTEAVRAGFKAAYEAQDYKSIVGVAAKLPENVLQEDEKLLMYYDVASMRLGDE